MNALRAHETKDDRINRLVNQLEELLECRVLAVITSNATLEMNDVEVGLVCPYERRAEVCQLLNWVDWNDMIEEVG